MEYIFYKDFLDQEAQVFVWDAYTPAPTHVFVQITLQLYGFDMSCGQILTFLLK